MTCRGGPTGDYLNVKAGDEVVSLYPHRETVGVAVIEAPTEESDTGQDVAVGSVGGAAMGALIGGRSAPWQGLPSVEPVHRPQMWSRPKR